MRFVLIILLAILALSWPAYAQRTPPAASAPQFIEIDDDALLSSRLIGLNVQNADGEDLGKIEDVALQGGQLVGVVLSVGEILGDSQRYIAVDPSSISIRYTEGENTWKATLNAKIDQLKAAPEFRYEGKWKR
jgi:sporulation protein YlmC with PRC-barrel domain